MLSFTARPEDHDCVEIHRLINDEAQTKHFVGHVLFRKNCPPRLEMWHSDSYLSLAELNAVLTMIRSHLADYAGSSCFCPNCGLEVWIMSCTCMRCGYQPPAHGVGAGWLRQPCPDPPEV